MPLLTKLVVRCQGGAGQARRHHEHHAAVAVTVTTIRVSGTEWLVTGGIFGRIWYRKRLGVAAGPGGMLVLVMTEVCCANLLFVPAIRGYGRPAELERQKGQQENGEDSTHGAGV